MKIWLVPLTIAIGLCIALSLVWWICGYDFIAEHHVVFTFVVGVVIGLPLLLWRTFVANQQLKTSIRIAETANTDRIDGTFASGVNMLGHDAPATNSAGITVLTDLVQAHPRYTMAVVASFCAFVRTHSDRHRKFNDQNYEIFKAFDQWFKPENSHHVNKERILNLRGINVSGVILEHIDFHFALSGSNIEHSFFIGVDFTGIQLDGLTCSDTVFEKSNFDRTDLSNGTFVGADFSECSFRRTDISGIRLLGHTRYVELNITKEQLMQARWSKPIEIGGAIRDLETGELLKPFFEKMDTHEPPRE